MKVVSVKCASTSILHWARYEAGLGTSVHTLCLERWKDYATAQEDPIFCPICVKNLKLYVERFKSIEGAQQ